MNCYIDNSRKDNNNTITLNRRKTILIFQQLLTITMDKSNLTTREKLIIKLITTLIITPTPRYITTTLIRACTTTLNIVLVNMVFVKLVHDLKGFI